MKVQWLKKNVNLQLLSKFIESFFIGRGFKTTTVQKSANLSIYASLPAKSLNFEVKIAGCPDDFTIELDPKGYKENFIKIGLMTLPIGGGNLILRELKFKERFRKLEDDFWRYVEKTVCNLTNSFSS
jgi:hypothetical protein